MRLAFARDPAVQFLQSLAHIPVSPRGPLRLTIKHLKKKKVIAWPAPFGFVFTKIAVALIVPLVAPCALADDPKLETPAQKEAPTAFAADKPVPVLDWGVGDGKSYWVPAYEIPAFELILNRYDRYAVDPEVL